MAPSSVPPTIYHTHLKHPLGPAGSRPAQVLPLELGLSPLQAGVLGLACRDKLAFPEQRVKTPILTEPNLGALASHPFSDQFTAFLESTLSLCSF